MKLILMSGIALLLSIASYSQVYRLKAFSAHIAILNENGEEISNKDLWSESDIVTVINFSASKVQVYTKPIIDIDLVNKISYRDDSDVIVTHYMGVDDIGKKCKISIAAYKGVTDKHIATLVINYPDMRMTLVYRLKRDE